MSRRVVISGGDGSIADRPPAACSSDPLQKKRLEELRGDGDMHLNYVEGQIEYEAN